MGIDEKSDKYTFHIDELSDIQSLAVIVVISFIGLFFLYPCYYFVNRVCKPPTLVHLQPSEGPLPGEELEMQ